MTGQHEQGLSPVGRVGATLLFAAFAALPAQTQTYTVLHRFTGPDGFLPEAGLIADPAGNLFGTTLKGGTSDCGTVFKLDKTGITVVHNFTCEADGGYPYAGLIRDSAGNLYGTTETGGATERYIRSRCPARRLCCINSQGPRTGGSLLPV